MGEEKKERGGDGRRETQKERERRIGIKRERKGSEVVED